MVLVVLVVVVVRRRGDIIVCKSLIILRGQFRGWICELIDMILVWFFFSSFLFGKERR